MQNAYWAAMPIWVVAQPSRGLLLERALYRLLGTLLGALAGFVVLTQASSLLQLMLLAAVIALCAGMTHLLRGTSAYAWLMAGMTAAVVVIPSALSPQNSWTLALARVECTLIGVLAVTLVLWLFTPKTRRADFYHRARALAADAVDFAAQSLSGGTDPATELRILKALSDIDGAARPISAGSLRGYRHLRHLDQLLLASLNIMAAGQAMGCHLRPEAQAAAALASRLQQVAERLRSEEPADSILSAPPANLPPRRLARLEQALEQLCQAAA
ncbi:MAG TPA: FUSC family protein, partial [Pseudomonas sp.]|nr:FUSC family protein [Pseudomonas sp.]